MKLKVRKAGKTALLVAAYPSGTEDVLLAGDGAGADLTAELIADRFNQHKILTAALALACHRLDDIGKTEPKYESPSTLEHCRKVLRVVDHDE